MADDERQGVAGWVIAAASAALILGLLGWGVWLKFGPLDLFEAPAVWPVAFNVVHPGEVVFSDLKFCKRTGLSAEIGRTITGTDRNGSEHTFAQPTIPGNMPAGCYSKRLPVATVPQHAPPGTYRVLIAIYDYSTFRVVQQQYMTEEFDVVPASRVSSPHGQE